MNPIVKIRREQILRMLDGFRVQVQTTVGLLEVEADVDTEWVPVRRVNIPRHVREHHALNGLPSPAEIWANPTYEVMVYQQEDVVHLSIKRYDRAAVHNWRHFQQMKNEIVGEFREALEMYPSEARLADNANQYHLWVLPEGMTIPFGFPNGIVVRDPDDVEAWNTMGHAGRQEPFQPGLTVGAGMQGAMERDGVKIQDAMKEQAPK